MGLPQFKLADQHDRYHFLRQISTHHNLAPCVPLQDTPPVPPVASARFAATAANLVAIAALCVGTSVYTPDTPHRTNRNFWLCSMTSTSVCVSAWTTGYP